MFEKKVKSMFDYQLFSGNKELEAMLHEAEHRCARVLSDDELEFIAAAGESDLKEEEKKN